MGRHCDAVFCLGTRQCIVNRSAGTQVNGQRLREHALNTWGYYNILVIF